MNRGREEGLEGVLRGSQYEASTVGSTTMAPSRALAVRVIDRIRRMAQWSPTGGLIAHASRAPAVTTAANFGGDVVGGGRLRFEEGAACWAAMDLKDPSPNRMRAQAAKAAAAARAAKAAEAAADGPRKTEAWDPVAGGDVRGLLNRARESLERLPNVVELHMEQSLKNSTPQQHAATKRLVVVGDTHGQLFDVLQMFKREGFFDHLDAIAESEADRSDPLDEGPLLPDRKGNTELAFLFNGDIVDRGIYGVELALLLLAVKVGFPDTIHFTRGNHESRAMTSSYGFKSECTFKYGNDVYAQFMNVFDALPTAAIVNTAQAQRVFVVHGGLFSDPSIGLDKILAARRLCEPPRDGLLHDAIWSDPGAEPGRNVNRNRGGGLKFGADVTESFLRDNGLDFVIRSHEVRDQGFSLEHNGQLCTLFSAPQYCGMPNFGATAVFQSQQEEFMTLEQYDGMAAPEISWVADAYNASRQRAADKSVSKL